MLGVFFVLVASESAVSILAPPLVRDTTRVEVTLRPFVSVPSQGAGAIADVTVEHYFRAPLKVGVSMLPVAVAAQREGATAIGYALVQVAWAMDLFEIGGAVGAHLASRDDAGFALSTSLRLGALDGLKLSLSYGYAEFRNRYTHRTAFGFSQILTLIEVPVAARAAVVVESGFGPDLWFLATVGLKVRLRGQGGPGSWAVRTGFGMGWVMHRLSCGYDDDPSCGSADWAYGPTMVVGVDRRF